MAARGQFSSLGQDREGADRSERGVGIEERGHALRRHGRQRRARGHHVVVRRGRGHVLAHQVLRGIFQQAGGRARGIVVDAAPTGSGVLASIPAKASRGC
jgi:hypothetical protein